MKTNCYATSTCLFSLIQKRLLRTSSTGIRSPHPLSSTPTKAPLLENSSSLPSAVSVCGKPCLNQNTQSVLHFLKSHHFDDAQIARVVKKAPRVLNYDVEDNLKPKFEFLIANGISGKLLPQIISSTPRISGSSLEFKIKPCFEFLRSYVDSDEKIAVTIKRYPDLLCSNLKGTFQSNIDLLIKEGVPLDRVSKLIVFKSVVLLRNHPDRVVDAVNAVKNLGLEPGDKMFVYALAVKLQINEKTWTKKIEVMKSFGWSEEETLRAFTRYPQILASSEKKIRSVMDFFNAARWGQKLLFSHPNLLYLSVEKRILPRYNVMNVLFSKNLVEKELKITRLLIMSEKKFVENYIVKYADEVPGLLDMFVSTAKRKNEDA